MKDFTQQAYKTYLKAIKKSYQTILTFERYFQYEPKPNSFCIIRHDVDRKPKNALQMARLENEMGIESTYYFRAKSHTFKPDILKAISKIGHEVGYHYECLAESNGDTICALKIFENNLKRFRSIVPIKTISMHGAPFKPFRNYDMWKNKNHLLLRDEYGIYGEVYLDIDYSDIAYINDTGRNWNSARMNIDDKVLSTILPNFRDGKELYNYLINKPHSKMVFQIHPERWASNIFDYTRQYLTDTAINFIKFLIIVSSGRGKQQ